MKRNHDKTKGTPVLTAANATTHHQTISALAVHLAQAAMVGGVAMEVVRLLTGGRSGEVGSIGPERQGAVEGPSWDGHQEAPAFSGRITTQPEDDGELSRLVKAVRERRTSPHRRPKHASS